MAELTKTQVKAAADRAAELSLQDDDVALQTSDTMPDGLGVRGDQVDTAGSDQHGPVHSFTRAQVDKALANWSSREGSRSSSSSSGTRRSAGNGRRKGGRRQDTETGTTESRATEADQPPQTGQPSGTEPPPPAAAEADQAGQGSDEAGKGSSA